MRMERKKVAGSIGITVALLIVLGMFAFAPTGAQQNGQTGQPNVQGCATPGSSTGCNPPVIGGVTFNGNRASLSVDARGRLTVGVQTAGADAVNNSSLAYLRDDWDQTNLVLVTAPLSFNGSTWDRAGYCQNFVTLTQAASTTAQIVAVSGSTKIRVCSFFVNSANTNTVTIESGTGTNCGTAVHNSTGAMNVAANGTIAIPGGGPGAYNLLGQASDELCLVTGAGTGGVTGGLMYGQW